MFGNKGWLICWLLTMQGLAPVVHGELLDQFDKEYPAAAEKLNAAYAHSKAMGTLTSTGDDGNNRMRLSFENCRRGSAVRVLVTCIDSKVSSNPTGTVSADVGTRDDYFQLFRKPGDEDFTIYSFGPWPDFDASSRLKLAPLFAATCVDDTCVSDHMPNSDWNVKSAQMDALDGHDACRVDFAAKAGEGFLVEGHVWFFLPSWAIARWQVVYRKPPILVGATDKNLTYEARVAYDDAKGFIPKVRGVDRWRVRAGKRVDERLFDVTKLEFVDVPEADFHIEAFGLKPPPGPITPGQK